MSAWRVNVTLHGKSRRYMIVGATSRDSAVMELAIELGPLEARIDSVVKLAAQRFW